MLVKKYVAKSVLEAQQMVEKELGTEAIILNSRQIKGKGIRKFFGIKNFEVTAAVERSHEETETESEPLILTPQTTFAEALNNVQYEKNLQEFKSAIAQEGLKELSYKDFINNKDKKLPSVAQFLINKELFPPLALECAQRLQTKYGKEILVDKKDNKQLFNILTKELASIIKVAGPFSLQHGKPKVVAFIGPSGVGKTTTLLKIAFQYIQELQKKVAIISFDTEDESGMVKSVTNNYDIPLLNVTNEVELADAINKLQIYDLILIDTIGCNPMRKGEIESLASHLQTNHKVETTLVLSSTTKAIDMLGAIEQFSSLKFETIIMTKTDETICHGFFVNICSTTGKKISYITNGVKISEDLSIANSEDIARMILLENNNPSLDLLRQRAFSG